MTIELLSSVTICERGKVDAVKSMVLFNSPILIRTKWHSFGQGFEELLQEIPHLLFWVSFGEKMTLKWV